MKIAVLTGSGISQESGIPTFRGQDGLWEDHRIEDVASPQGFACNPELVHRFYNERRKKLQKIQPNRAHIALAQFERLLAEKSSSSWLRVITQNIDGLHSKAGSRNVFAMHGELDLGVCQHCNDVFSVHSNLLVSDICKKCKKKHGLRPRIVWFGEMPLYMEEIIETLNSCDIYIAIGTSSTVHPAAGFIQIAKKHGARCIEINLQPTEMSVWYDETILGKATNTVSDFFRDLATNHL